VRLRATLLLPKAKIPIFIVDEKLTVIQLLN
jgi:hypothetical protein